MAPNSTIQFKSEKDKKDSAIKALGELQETTGWKVVEKVLDKHIQDVELKLYGEKKLTDGEKKLSSESLIELLQYKRRDRIRLKNMPNDLIEEYKDKESVPPELDPYE